MKKIVALLLMFSFLVSSCCVTAEASDKKKLSAPTISVKSTSAGNPKITWKAVDGADGYRVYRKTSTDKKYVKVTTTSKLSATDKKWSAEEDSTIKYVVKAYFKDDDGNTTWSEKSTAKSWTVPTKAGKTKTTPTPTPSPVPEPEPEEISVWIAAESGKKFHTNSKCRGLANNNGLIELTISEARSKGYSNCKICSKGLE